MTSRIDIMTLSSQAHWHYVARNMHITKHTGKIWMKIKPHCRRQKCILTWVYDLLLYRVGLHAFPSTERMTDGDCRLTDNALVLWVLVDLRLHYSRSTHMCDRTETTRLKF